MLAATEPGSWNGGKKRNEFLKYKHKCILLLAHANTARRWTVDRTAA